MSKPPKVVFVCQECGSQSPKWLGRCGDCGAWNSFVEERTPEPSAAAATAAHRYALAGASGSARLYSEIQIEQHARLTTGIDEFDRALGSIGQVREAATQLLFAAKGHNIPTFLVGHVTKDGSLAGPKALEHVVDTVLYFEGERHHSHRVVRAVKNRFGAISELGVFEMTSAGLRPVPNPSKMFLAERPSNVPGSAVLCSVEGSRPILVEVQALVSTSTYGTARRTASGIDQQRLSLLLAVLEKRAGLNLIGDDVFVNIAGGMTVDEPASDLGVLAAVASSVRNRVIPATTAMFGEVGLAGEIRGITQAMLRVREAAQMGFRRCIMPAANIDPADRSQPGGECELVGVRTVGEALDALLQ